MFGLTGLFSNSIRTTASPCFGKMAVAAQQLKAIWIAVLNRPLVHRRRTDFGTVCTSVIIHMVKLQNIAIAFTTRNTNSAVAFDCLFAPLSHHIRFVITADLAQTPAINGRSTTAFAKSGFYSAIRIALCSFCALYTSLPVRTRLRSTATFPRYKFSSSAFGSASVICRQTRIAASLPSGSGLSTITQAGFSGFRISQSLTFRTLCAQFSFTSSLSSAYDAQSQHASSQSFVFATHSRSLFMTGEFRPEIHHKSTCDSLQAQTCEVAV